MCVCVRERERERGREREPRLIEGGFKHLTQLSARCPKWQQQRHFFLIQITEAYQSRLHVERIYFMILKIRVLRAHLYSDNIDWLMFGEKLI